MTQQTLTTCSQRLGVSPFTLRQWCEKAGIDLEQQKSEADPRQKWLSDEQLARLAQEHGRILDEAPPAPEPIPPNAYKLLMAQAARAQQEAEQIRAAQAPLEAGLTALRAQAEQIGAASQEHQQHLTTLEQLQTMTTAHVLALQSESEQLRQQLSMELDVITTNTTNQTTALAMQDQAMAAKLDQIAANFEHQQQQLQAQLDAVIADQQQTAATLETLVATSEELGRHLKVAQATLTTDQLRLELLTTTTKTHEERIEAITSRIEAVQEQTQQDIKRQVEHATTSLQAAFQAEFLAFREAAEKQARDLYAAIQSAEQDEARDVMQLTQQIEANESTSVKRGEAEITTRRLEQVVKELSVLDQRLQVERTARERLALLLTTSLPGQPSIAPQAPDAEKPRPGRRPKGKDQAKDA